MNFIFGILAIFYSTICLANGPVTAPPIVVAVPSGWGTTLAMQINLKRLDANLPQLALDDQLICAASLQAAFLAQVTGICDHRGLYNSDLNERLSLCGGGNASGEVLGCGYLTFVTVVDAWLNSPGHRKLIMDPLAKRIGGAMINKQWVVVMGF